MRRPLNKSIWLKRLLFMAAIAPFVLIWGEIFTRILLPQSVDSRMNIFEPDPVVGFVYKPHATTYEKGREYNALYQINSVGLRDREYGPKEDRVFRILLLGDSFSASHGLSLEESLSRQLERELQKIIDSDGLTARVKVINAASGGYSPYNYWKAYRRWAPIFEPDAVLVGISPDDYDCSNENSQYVIEGGETLAVVKYGQQPRKHREDPIRKIRKWLSWNSEFYIVMRNFIYYNELAGSVNLWMNAKGEAQVNQLQQYIVPQPETMKEAWEKTLSYMRKLREETAADGVALIVLSIPLKLEIDSTEFHRNITASGLKQEHIDLMQPMKVVSTFCRMEGISFLDPRLALKNHHAETPCYFVYDGHWNAEGISVAAASVAKQWRDTGLPPWVQISPGNETVKAGLTIAENP